MEKILISISIFFAVFVTFAHCHEKKPVIFNFGDSNSDTGGFYLLHKDEVPPPSNGRVFFHMPSGRYADGRLIIDFLCQSVNMSFLTPYLRSLDISFKNGVNFAIAGSVAYQVNDISVMTLKGQLSWFEHFRSLSLSLPLKLMQSSYTKDTFEKALYTIDIGQNDLTYAFQSLSTAEVIAKIPTEIAEVKNLIMTLYKLGGRNFWVHGTGPLGCLPGQRYIYASKNVTDFDKHGCLQSLNLASQEYNNQLSALCQQLRSELNGVTIVYVDIYSIKYDIWANSAAYGFEKPWESCQIGPNVCSETSRRICWDGIHYTEATNELVASKILSTNYNTPKLSWDHFFQTYD